MSAILTYGYLAGSPEHLVTAVREHDAWLVDCRYHAWSQQRRWQPERLVHLVGGRYVHVTALGNVNYRGGPIQLANPDRGVAVVAGLLRSRAVILLCACREVATCHRRVAAELLAAHTGLAVIHLPGLIRVTPTVHDEQPRLL